MTDKEKILNEIERLINNHDSALDYEAALEDVRNFIDSLQEEPVSEELEKAAVEAFKKIVDSDKNNFLEIFKAGANWQEEQFEKNRLKHCNSITNEQAELEQGFIDQHLDKYNRMPTFLDAIEYGMNLQKEQMMKDAFDTELDEVYGVLTVHMPYHNGVIGEKVKLIIVKEE